MCKTKPWVCGCGCGCLKNPNADFGNSVKWGIDLPVSHHPPLKTATLVARKTELRLSCGSEETYISTYINQVYLLSLSWINHCQACHVPTVGLLCGAISTSISLILISPPLSPPRPTPLRYKSIAFWKQVKRKKKKIVLAFLMCKHLNTLFSFLGEVNHSEVTISCSVS